ncbi:hypothetical protein BD769DRAFT_1101237 [Suillus cothurnatus]|nr:hypothetical protein BD769DRAFT_1101237 [Suillus cothurnatus]
MCRGQRCPLLFRKRFVMYAVFLSFLVRSQADGIDTQLMTWSHASSARDEWDLFICFFKRFDLIALFVLRPQTLTLYLLFLLRDH